MENKYNCRIGKITPKGNNVLTSEKFAQSEMDIYIKKELDGCLQNIRSEPTGFFIAVFGDKGDQVRAYQFKDGCEVTCWTFPETVKMMMR